MPNYRVVSVTLDDKGRNTEHQPTQPPLPAIISLQEPAMFHGIKTTGLSRAKRVTVFLPPPVPFLLWRPGQEKRARDCKGWPQHAVHQV